MRRCVADSCAAMGKRRRKQEVGGGNDTAEAAVFADLECMFWESILGSRYFRPAREGGEGKGIRSVAFNVSYSVQEVSNSVTGSQKGHLCSGNERCAVEYRPVATLTLSVTTHRDFVDLRLSDRFLSCT